MNKDPQYAREIEKAKREVQDFKERGVDAIGGTWDELRKEIFTPEEIAACDARVAALSLKRLDISTLTEEELHAELEKGYSDIASGDVKPATEAFTELRKELGIDQARI